MRLKLKSILLSLIMLTTAAAPCAHGGARVLTAAAASTDISCAFASACPGNIFFDGDFPRIDVMIDNQSSAAKKITVRYEVRDSSETVISSKFSSINLSPGGTTAPCYPSVSKYGVYTLGVYITGADGSDLGSYFTDFSLCPRADYDDYDSYIGIGAHFNWTVERNAADGTYIMKKAGIDHLREGYSWSGAEPKTKGVYAETRANKAYLDAAQGQGMSVLAMAGYGNDLYIPRTQEEIDNKKGNYNFPVTDEARTAFANYIYNFLSRNEGRIHTVELWNEPDLEGFNKNGATGEDYARLAKAVYDRIHTDFPDVEISAFALAYAYAGNAANKAKGYKFMQDALSADVDGDGKFDLYKYIDIISVHHYLRDVSRIVPRTDELRSLLSQYGCGGKKIYHTEFGCSATKTLGGAETQAVFLAKYAAAMRAYNAGDRFYIYDFSNDGEDADNFEHNLGIVNYHKSRTPYSAKPSLISLANLNRIIGNCEAESAQSDGNITTFGFKDRFGTKDAYMFFAGTTGSYKGSGEISFPAQDGRTVFYDMYGNTVEPQFDGTEYTLTVSEKPIYAVVYHGDEEINAYASGGRMYVDGRFSLGSEGESIGVKVFDSDGKLVYLNQYSLSDNRTLRFSFPCGSGEYSIWLGMASRDTVLKIAADGSALAKLSVIANGAEANSTESLANADSVTVEARVFDKNCEDFVLVAAAYKGGAIQSVKIIDRKNMTYADGKYSADISKDSFADADEAGFYILKSLTNMTPLGRNIHLKHEGGN